VVRHRNDEDEFFMTQMIAANEEEVRAEMEQLLSRSDFVVYELG